MEYWYVIHNKYPNNRKFDYNTNYLLGIHSTSLEKNILTYQKIVRSIYPVSFYNNYKIYRQEDKINKQLF